jgi:pimeloyl-ACP methyl ester carboxylesterase
LSLLIAVITLILLLILYLKSRRELKEAYGRLKQYQSVGIDTEFGNITYVIEGEGEAILLSHGIFGGYDQGITSLRLLVGNNYRKVAPSRFGYPGSDAPINSTPVNQAKAFVALLDELGIEETYVIATSAGGAAAIKMALDYPERVKGLILLSSGLPNKKKMPEDIIGMQGPPEPLLNDFPMWLSLKYFGFVFEKMFASEIPDDMNKTMLPVKPRKIGITLDTNITNSYMDLYFEDYPIDELNMPILVIQAKDDPMIDYKITEKFIEETDAEKCIYESGGHLISGHGNQLSLVIKQFIEKVSSNTE